jgi:hypothetical protein
MLFTLVVTCACVLDVLRKPHARRKPKAEVMRYD